MHPVARMISPSVRTYRGSITDPSRWATWTPAEGDILVCTPPKSGTTWTQTILAMLLNGGPDLPEKVPVLSPWVDADLGIAAEEVAGKLAEQSGRRVVKTHTPANGFPVWEGVRVIAVYRHPLDMFFSLRKHIANTKVVEPDHPMNWPLPRSFRHFIQSETAPEDFDRDTLSTVAMHYVETALSGRMPGSGLFHYSDMLREPRRAVAELAGAAGIDASDATLDEVAKATSFASMKNRAADFAPVGGTGYWKSDAAFFDSASSGKWEGHLSPEELGLYEARLAELVPDERARRWLEIGDGD